MNEALPIRPTGAANSAGPVSSAPKSDSGGAVAFKALLDELEQRAQALEVESSKDLTKDDLAGAVDSARISLEQMLSLKDQLLEAWQASQLEQPQLPRPEAA
jgi:flagellar hook-basal body complex protein FliE